MKDATTEKAILEAALAEFAEKGFHGARMQAIANRAGANKALLHYYYRSKEQLYRRALEPIGAAFSEAVVPKVKNLEPGDLRGLARILATFIITEVKKAPHSHILITELASGGSYFKKLDGSFLNSLNSLQDTILAFIQEGIDMGRVKSYHPMKIFSSIMGMCWNIYILAPMADVFYEQAGIVKDDAFYQDYINLIEETAASGLEISD